MDFTSLAIKAIKNTVYKTAEPTLLTRAEEERKNRLNNDLIRERA